jgi:hypothetical protein
MGGRTAVVFHKMCDLPVVLKSKHYRSLVTWGVLALFTATMVGGEGLHCLPGLGHSCCSHDEDHAEYCSNVGYEVSVLAGHLSIHSADAEQHVSHTTCAICSFFAQAHCLPVVLADGNVPLKLAEMVFAVSGLKSGHFVQVYHCRAPPFATL